MTRRERTQPGPDLFATTRTHDLPPRWDGHPVQWGPWEPAGHRGTLFICPPMPPAPCPRCGSTSANATARGHVTITLTDTTNSVAPAQGVGGVLIATRCPDCRFDTVTEIGGDVWELDPNDYTEEGSWAT